VYHPSKQEFLRLAKRGNLIPVYREILADQETPVSAFQKLGARANCFLLESVEGGEHIGRYSFVGANPRELIVEPGGQRAGRDGDPLRRVEAALGKYRAVAAPGLPRFTGGAVGFLGYEYIHHLEPVERPSRDDLGMPMLYYLVTDTLLAFDRIRQTITVISNAFTDGKRAGSAYDEACKKVDAVIARLRKPARLEALEYPRDLPAVKFRSNFARAAFEANVARGKEYIQAGDIIQFVPSQRFSVKTKASPLMIYRALRSVNPSPYMFLFQGEGFALIGSSPEVHVRCTDGTVEIRPIAGTRPRGETVERDLELEKELLADPKERAEHLMLVDLARNDIGRVCDFGSVHVPEFMVIERYSHVMHIVSHVTGRLQKGRSPFDLMRATFPAGTVTGAPKVRAMQIIAELERTRRGPYAGALGYFGFDGNMDSCIVIRTILLRNGVAHVQAGAGIVADSVPASEYQETVNKAKGMMRAISFAERVHGSRFAVRG
jgi:anthranilate synthase component 1